MACDNGPSHVFVVLGSSAARIALDNEIITFVIAVPVQLYKISLVCPTTANAQSFWWFGRMHNGDAFYAARPCAGLATYRLSEAQRCGRRRPRDELPSPHSITSSARASNVDGTVRPSAL